MNKETKDTLKKVAGYAETEKKNLAKKMCEMTAAAAILLVAFIVMRAMGLVDTASSYKNFADFRKYVIEYAQKEINELSDMKFDFETITKGRKTIAVKFIIQFKNSVERFKTNYLVENL